MMIKVDIVSFNVLIGSGPAASERCTCQIQEACPNR